MVKGGIQLYNDDCFNVLPGIPDNSVELVVCDLPYGTTASNWDKALPMDKLWREYNRLLTPNGSVVLFANGIFTPRVMTSNITDYKYRLVWIKRNSTNFVHAKNRPLVKSEDILVFSKGGMGHKSLLGEKRMTYNPQGIIQINKPMRGGITRFTNTIAGKRPSHKDEFVREYTNYPTDILDKFPEPPTSKRNHPNEKPVELMKFLVSTYSNENETVLDNCMGAGSTGIACKLTNREFIGIEKDAKYFNIASDRINNYEAQIRMDI